MNIEPMQLRSAIAESYLAHGFTDEFIDQLVSIAVVREFQPGEFMTRESEETHDLMILASGGAEIRSLTDEVIGYLHSGMPFGEVAFMDEKPRSSSVVTTTSSEVIVLPEGPLRRLMHDDKEMAIRALMNLSRVLCQRLRRANQQIAALQAIEEAQGMYSIIE